MSPVQEAEERLRQAERDRDVARMFAAEAMSMLDNRQLTELYRTMSGSHLVLAPAS